MDREGARVQAGKPGRNGGEPDPGQVVLEASVVCSILVPILGYFCKTNYQKNVV